MSGAYPFHEGPAWDIVGGEVARGPINIVDIQPWQVSIVKNEGRIIAQGIGVGHVDGEFMCKIAVVHEIFVGLVRDEWMWLEELDRAFIVIVSICPRVSHLQHT